MEALERILADLAPAGPLAEARLRAAEQVRAHGVPSTRQEAWKYTSLASLKDVAYRAASEADGAVLDAPSLAALPLASASPHRAVLVNGRFRADLSTLDALPAGVRVTSIAAAVAADAEHVATVYAEQYAPEAVFTALNAALLDDGLIIEVDADSSLDAPLHLVFVAAGATPLLRTPRVIVRAGRHARLRMIEEFVGQDGDHGLTNVVSDLSLDEGAVVDHHRLQNEPVSTAQIGRVRATLAANATFNSDSVTFGGALTRIDIEVALAARGARCRLNGLFATTGTQHVDHHTLIDHQVGDTHSEELYRGILDGRSRGVFNGKVLVRRDAQCITAHQASNNLLLSRQAEVDTKPELEIYADDVSCAHGATVGELDTQALFYLRSRGIDEAQSRALLTYAFAEKVVETIPLDSIRHAIEERFIGAGALSELEALLKQS